MIKINYIRAQTYNIAVMFVAALSLIACSPSVQAGVYDCVPINAKGASKLKETHGVSLLGSEASKEIAINVKSKDARPAVVLVLDSKGNIHTFIPGGGPGTPRLCKAKFPLHAGDLLNITNINVQATSNPKVCWIDENGQYKCIEW